MELIRAFEYNDSICKLFKCDNCDGIVPLRLLLLKSRDLRLVSADSCDGIEPVSEFILIDIPYLKDDKADNCDGIELDKELVYR